MVSRTISLVLALVLGLAACAPADSVDTSIQTDSTSGATSSSAPAEAISYLAFGDSWPEGAHCAGCTPFPALWAEGLESQTGRDIEFTDLTGGSEPSPDESKGSASLNAVLRTHEETRNLVRTADIILIATGPNDMETIFTQLQEGTCGGPDGFNCIRSLGQHWKTDFLEILTEIETLREGAPTAIRLVNATNPFISLPDMNAGMPENFASTGGALIFELLTTAMCGAAAAHGAVCVDIRPILNGSSLNQPVDENSQETMQAVADALAATGLEELDS